MKNRRRTHCGQTRRRRRKHSGLKGRLGRARARHVVRTIAGVRYVANVQRKLLHSCRASARPSGKLQQRIATGVSYQPIKRGQINRKTREQRVIYYIRLTLTTAVFVACVVGVLYTHIGVVLAVATIRLFATAHGVVRLKGSVCSTFTQNRDKTQTDRNIQNQQTSPICNSIL
jgi:hypothetical protein